MTLPEFSEREKEVAELIRQGKSNKQIAQALGIAIRTVEFHATHIYEKLGAASRAEAIVMLAQADLRESAGVLRTPAGVLRSSTVVNGAQKAENGENSNGKHRRFTMRTILIILAALAALSLACLAAVLVLAPQMYTSRIFTSTMPAVTFTPYDPALVPPAATPYETPPARPTYTPYEPTPTAASEDPYATQVITSLSPLLSANGRWTYEGASFAQNPALASSASGQVIAAKAAGPDMPWWLVYPQYVQIALEGYPVSGSIYDPHIAVYLVEEYRAANPYAAETLDQLKDVLDRRPADVEQMPFLPLINARQSFYAGVQYLDFQNGRGVRYLTIYGQAPAPVNNEELFYTFQGLTDDGRHFISMVLPIQHPSLLASANDLSQAAFEAMLQDYANYRATASADLEAQPPASFTPGLDQLDALVQSLQIDR